MRKGVLVSMADGVTTNYALGSLEDRGILFLGTGVKTYTGVCGSATIHVLDIVALFSAACSFAYFPSVSLSFSVWRRHDCGRALARERP